ncbi:MULTISPECIES: hypothetical protein [Flammeovirga]|nr:MULTISPECIES: hypothetical protein [Flammeovirga]
MKYIKILLLIGFTVSLIGCTSYKHHVKAGYNPNDTDNVYHLVHE